MLINGITFQQWRYVKEAVKEEEIYAKEYKTLYINMAMYLSPPHFPRELTPEQKFFGPL